ncbi:MAG: isocitrate lyase/phosphoenolpyruvate mutase family protein [Planctomycetota bacterium]
MITRHPGAILRDLCTKGPVAAPGAYNGLTAREVARAGFTATYLSGGALSASSGVPDIGVLTLDTFAERVREVAQHSGLPVIADADTGFGEEEMVRRTVIEYNHAGAAACHIEDQVFPKRCGHLAGKQLIPVDHCVDKVKWAAQASNDCAGGDFIICARTDARSVEGMSAAIERAHAYTEAGATMLFPEGLHSEDEFAEFATAINKLTDSTPLLLANMTEFGKTPHIPLDRFGQLGYHVVIYPVSTLRIAQFAIAAFLRDLKATGTAAAWEDRMQTRTDLYELLGYDPSSTGYHFPAG